VGVLTIGSQVRYFEEFQCFEIMKM
jgi:hypothetical protein